MRPLGVIELQRVRDAVDDAFGHSDGVAALEPRVVLGGDAGENGNLIAAQARNATPLSAVHGQSDLFGSDLGATRAQERPDLLTLIGTDVTRLTLACHVIHPKSGSASMGVPASTRLSESASSTRHLIP